MSQKQQTILLLKLCYRIMMKKIKTVQENFDQDIVDKCKTSETTAKDTGLNDSKLGMPDATKVMVDVCEQMEISISDNSAESTSVEPLTIVEVNESEALKIVQHSDKPLVVEKTETIQDIRPKKVSRQESVADSDCVPDIEEVKDRNIDTNEELEDDEEFEKFKRARSNSRSSYEETLAGMDPEILKELGLDEKDESPKDKTVLEMDLSQLPDETPEERMKRIEEKASGIVIEEDIVPRKSRSRSRSRSKSRPPNLETVKEQKKDEIIEAAKFYGILPSLDTIKESPSTASMLGMLQGGMSSASVNNMLQESMSAVSLNKDSLLSPSCDKKSFSQINESSEEDGVVETSDIPDNTNHKPEEQEREIKNDSILEEKVTNVHSDPKEPIKEEKSKKKKAQRSDTVSLLLPENNKDAEEADMPVGIKLTNLEIEKKNVNEEDNEETKMTATSNNETKNDRDRDEKMIKERKHEEKVNALKELELKEKQEILRVKEEATKSALLQNRETQES